MDRSILDPQVRKSLDLFRIECDVLECDPAMADTAAFCEHYGFSLAQAANTILVSSKKIEPPKYAVCVVLGTTRLDVNKKVSELMEVKRLSFADAEVTQSLTVMAIGGVTAIGISEIPIYVDSKVMDQERVVMGGGNRSSKIILDPQQLLNLPGITVVENLALAKTE